MIKSTCSESAWKNNNQANANHHGVTNPCLEPPPIEVVRLLPHHPARRAQRKKHRHAHNGREELQPRRRQRPAQDPNQQLARQADDGDKQVSGPLSNGPVPAKPPDAGFGHVLGDFAQCSSVAALVREDAKLRHPGISDNGILVPNRRELELELKLFRSLTLFFSDQLSGWAVLFGQLMAGGQDGATSDLPFIDTDT